MRRAGLIYGPTDWICDRSFLVHRIGSYGNLHFQPFLPRLSGPVSLAWWPASPARSFHRRGLLLHRFPRPCCVSHRPLAPQVSAQKFSLLKEFVGVGCSVLLTDTDVVYLQARPRFFPTTFLDLLVPSPALFPEQCRPTAGRLHSGFLHCVSQTRGANPSALYVAL